MADELERMLTVQDVTKLLQVHEETVRRWIRTGELRAVLLGSSKGGYRISRDEYERFIDEKFGLMGKAAA